MADSRYNRVLEISQVFPGYQIAMLSDRTCGIRYYHQAIVESVDLYNNTFNVIEKLPGGVRRNVFHLNDQEFWVIRNESRLFALQEVINRAASRIDDSIFNERYNFRSNNCEHFCEWCITGRSRSYQIDAMNAVVKSLLPVLERIWNLIDCVRSLTGPSRDHEDDLDGVQLV